MRMKNVNYPQAQFNQIEFARMTIKQLSAMLNSIKAEKAYMKTEMNKLGKLSLGNIASYYKALKNIQECNAGIRGIKSEMSKRAEKISE